MKTISFCMWSSTKINFAAKIKIIIISADFFNGLLIFLMDIFFKAAQAQKFQEFTKFSLQNVSFVFTFFFFESVLQTRMYFQQLFIKADGTVNITCRCLLIASFLGSVVQLQLFSDVHLKL